MADLAPTTDEIERLESISRTVNSDNQTGDRSLAETFPLADLKQWAGVEPSPKQFAMAGFIPAGEVTLITGKGGSNKSTFGQQLATCCAAGLPMLGYQTQRMHSLYLTAEDDDQRLHWMQAHICAQLGIAISDLAGKLHLGSLRGRLDNELLTRDNSGKAIWSASFELLRSTILRTRSQMVILDNSAHFYPGNENDRREVTAFINMLYSLCRDFGSTVLLVAHVNKAGDPWSGSTAWLNAVRSQIVIERPDDSIDPDLRVLTLGKANYARQDAEIRFRWHNFALATDQDLPADYATELKQSARIASENATFMKCLRKRVEQRRGEVGPNIGPNYAPTRFAEMPEAKGLSKSALARAMERLFQIGEIAAIEVKREGKGTTKTIIVEASKQAPELPPEPVPNTVTEPALTPPELPPALTYIDKSISGAAFGAAAPENGRAV